MSALESQIHKMKEEEERKTEQLKVEKEAEKEKENFEKKVDNIILFLPFYILIVPV